MLSYVLHEICSLIEQYCYLIVIAGSTEYHISNNIQWFSRNSKSHFARNLLANRRTNLTLIVRLRTNNDLLIEQLLIGEHYCNSIHRMCCSVNQLE